MKQQTYWGIHKNKKPKNILYKKPSKVQLLKAAKIAKSVILGALGATQVSTKASSIGDKAHKQKNIFETILNTSDAIITSIQYNPVETFKFTGRYGKKPKGYDEWKKNRAKLSEVRALLNEK